MNLFGLVAGITRKLHSSTTHSRENMQTRPEHHRIRRLWAIEKMTSRQKTHLINYDELTEIIFTP